MLPTDQTDRYRLIPACVGRRDDHLDLDRVEAGGAQLNGDPVSNDAVVFTPFAGNPCPNRGRRLLADPGMDQAAELDNAKEDGQEHEGDCQHCLQRLLPALARKRTGSGHEVWDNRCTI